MQPGFPVHTLSDVKKEILGIDWGETTILAKGDECNRINWMMCTCSDFDESGLGDPEAVVKSDTTIQRVEKATSYRFQNPSKSAKCYTIQSTKVGRISIYTVQDKTNTLFDIIFNQVADD